MSGKHKNPRAQITIPEEIYKTYKEFSLVSGRPLAKILCSVLMESEPVYKEILIALEASENNADQFKKEIRDRLLLKNSDALQQALEL